MTQRAGLLGELGDRVEHLADPVGVVTEVPSGLVDRLSLPDDLEAHLARPSRPATSTTFGRLEVTLAWVPSSATAFG
jgi:hypothetical protein